MDRLLCIALLGAIAAATPQQAPDVVLHGADGVGVRLSAYRGQVVLVDFWASWCVPCKASFPALDRIYREYRSRGVVVLAINLDEERKNAERFLSARPHEMPVLFDAKGDAPLAFGVKGMPSSFVIDRGGTIRFTHMGYTDTVDLSYRQEIAQLLSER